MFYLFICSLYPGIEHSFYMTWKQWICIFSIRCSAFYMYVYSTILQPCMFWRSTPHQCSLVHVHIYGCIVFIHVNLLSLSARGTTQHNQHIRTCAEGHRARVLKRPQGKRAFIIAFRHLLRSVRVLKNTEVKGHYSTICRHAYFGVLRLISAAWYTYTYVAALYLYT